MQGPANLVTAITVCQYCISCPPVAALVINNFQFTLLFMIIKALGLNSIHSGEHPTFIKQDALS